MSSSPFVTNDAGDSSCSAQLHWLLAVLARREETAVAGGDENENEPCDEESATCVSWSAASRRMSASALTEFCSLPVRILAAATTAAGLAACGC